MNSDPVHLTTYSNTPLQPSGTKTATENTAVTISGVIYTPSWLHVTNKQPKVKRQLYFLRDRKQQQ